MTRPAHESPAPASAERLEALVADLSGLDLVRAGLELERLSSDYFDYSPLLHRQLQGRLAQLVVRAQSVDDVLRVAAACARHEVALTPRGRAPATTASACPWPVAWCWISVG